MQVSRQSDASKTRKNAQTFGKSFDASGCCPHRVVSPHIKVGRRAPFRSLASQARTKASACPDLRTKAHSLRKAEKPNGGIRIGERLISASRARRLTQTVGRNPLVMTLSRPLALGPLSSACGNTRWQRELGYSGSLFGISRRRALPGSIQFEPHRTIFLDGHRRERQICRNERLSAQIRRRDIKLGHSVATTSSAPRTCATKPPPQASTAGRGVYGRRQRSADRRS